MIDRNRKLEGQYNSIKLIEPKITKKVKVVAFKTKTYLVGLSNRMKSFDSAVEKVSLRKEAKNLIEMKDVIRYTFICKHTKFQELVEAIRKELIAAGFKEVKLKNTWIEEDSVYKGINLQSTYKGFKVEFQFHTKNSYDIKEKIHDIYIINRVKTEEDDEVEYLNFWQSMPYGVELIEAFDNSSD